MPNDIGSGPVTPSNASTASGGSDSGMGALGELICRLNPYTELPFDKTNNMQTGKMEVGTLPPKPTGSYKATDAQTTATIACIEIEVEKNYGTQWTFKGQPQSVKTAFRIPYRFQVKDKEGNTLYWQTEYLLIGYAGGDGPG
ncbi:MAG: hypothetical protein WA864_12370 [Acetobacteraceae bacterium]|jgi:hypothetical protein